MEKNKIMMEEQVIVSKKESDQSAEMLRFEVANSDLKNIDIKALIHIVRGQPVLIDRDLAMLYQVEVKQMNRQVKRNKERFPEDFMFQLTKEEHRALKCQFGTSNEKGGDRRALPYAFTQQDIGILSGILRSKVAVETKLQKAGSF